MSIFDVFRYPISELPTPEELSALPNELFEKWRSETEWSDIRNRQSPEKIGEWYQQLTTEDRRYRWSNDMEEIELLRTMIKEYDGDL